MGYITEGRKSKGVQVQIMRNELIFDANRFDYRPKTILLSP